MSRVLIVDGHNAIFAIESLATHHQVNREQTREALVSWLQQYQDSTDTQIIVVSASDQSELRKILPSKIPGIAESNIFGGPASKNDNLSKVISQNRDQKIIFYGDAVQDAKAAMITGVFFIGLTQYGADPLALKTFCISHGLKYFLNCAEVDFR